MRLSEPIWCCEAERSQSHISWFLLSLTSGGTRSAVCVVWTGGRPEARPGRTPDQYERPDLSANFPADVLCCLKVEYMCSLEVVCTITGFEEAVRRGSGWKRSKSSGSSAKLTMRLDWTRAPRRQYTLRSRTYFSRCRRFFLQSLFQRIVCEIPGWFID